MPRSTFLAVSASPHVAAAPLPSLRAPLPADIPAPLSRRVSNEEVIARLVLTAHALLVGRFPTSGKWSMEAIPFVTAEAADRRCPSAPRAALAVARGPGGGGTRAAGASAPDSARGPLRPGV